MNSPLETFSFNFTKARRNHKSNEEPQEDKVRRIHYISGFDPRGPRFYHRLYQEEALKQARINGAMLEVGNRRKVSSLVHAWAVKGNWQGKAVTTEYEFMAWDDLVRSNWETNPLRLLARGIRFFVHCAFAGGFGRIRRASKGAFITSIFPFLYFW